MSCAPGGPSLDLCPTTEEITPQLLSLLPRGRAWSTHDGGPFPGTPLYQFWSAVAAVWAWINARICDLAAEFFCRTANETLDLWFEEYGLPDGCDPFPDLCTKVAAQGGTRCDYYAALALTAGWSITCTDINTACGGKAGAIRAGGFIAGKGVAPAVLFVTVDLSKSTAYLGGFPSADKASAFGGLPPPLAGRLMAGSLLACQVAGEWTPPFAGAMFSGGILACPIDLSGLECLLARIVHAEILIVYQVSFGAPQPGGSGDGRLDFSDPRNSGLLALLFPF